MATLLSRSALDMVLSIPEIWIMVFEYFDDEDNPDHASLASCSSVSHSWNILAERPLWRNLHSVIPLLKLLGHMTTIIRCADESPGSSDEETEDDGDAPWVGVYT